MAEKQKHILVPVDFTPSSYIALKEAIKLSGLLDLSLHLVHVLHGPAQNPGFYAEYTEDLKPIDEIAQQMYEDFLADFNHKNPELSKSVDNIEFEIITGTPHSRILEVIERDEPAYVIMGSQGLSGMKKLLIGSTAEKVIQKSTVPVMVVKSLDIEE